MNFSWIEDERLVGCRGPRTDCDLAFLRDVKGIRALVRLASEEETGMTEQRVVANGIEDCYEPVKDFTAPSQEQIDRVLKFIGKVLGQGKPVTVSCEYGKGRTGTILACFFVSLGYTANQAKQRLFTVRPVSREILNVDDQMETIREFARRSLH